MRPATGIALCALLLAASLAAVAQMRGGTVVTPFTPSPIVSAQGTTITFSPARSPQPFPRPAFFPGVAYLGDAWPSDYYTPAQPPAVIVVQPTSPTPTLHEEAKRPADPLLIEWQGDRYVRYTAAQTGANARGVPLDYAASPQAPAQPSRARSSSNAARFTATNSSPDNAERASAAELPATLVFRDGHHQDVTSFTIANRTIYVSGDYWSTGAWQQQIQIADLDIPTTLKLNQDRGVKFTLPTAPNQVITRP